jgi:hypothetical protein
MTRRKKHGGGGGPEALRRELQTLMEQQATAEALNNQVITPFIAALESVCGPRGYLLNIFGDSSNLVISTEDHAEAIYDLVEKYIDGTDLET